MANNLEQESATLTGWEIVFRSSNDNDDHQHDPLPRVEPQVEPEVVQEATGGCDAKEPIDAEPLAWALPEKPQVVQKVTIGCGAKEPIDAEPLAWALPEKVPGNVSGKKRTRSDFLGETQKDFTLQEVFEMENLHEIIQGRETSESTLDPQKILGKLKGWKILFYERHENNLGKTRIDKVYRHPTSKQLRSVRQVKKFIVNTSYIKKAADNAQGGSQEAVAESVATRPLASDERNIYLEVYQSLVDFFNPGTNPASYNL